VTPTPNVNRQANVLNAVAAVSQTDAWAVGSYTAGASLRALAQHWDGSAWTIVPTAPVGALHQFRGVAAPGSSDVWAVGEAGSHPLIEHWDGTAWSRTPVGLTAALYAASASTPTDVWAVGTGLGLPIALHWNGSRWRSVPVPTQGSSARLDAVFARTPSDVWAAGFWQVDGAHPYQTLIEHWNGATWSIVLSPSPGVGVDNFLYGITATSASDAWAVGSFSPSPGEIVEHWDGATWAASALPPGGAPQLRGVVAVSTNDVWAVGYHAPGTTLVTLVRHWDGTAWSIVPSGNIGTATNNYLLGVAALPEGVEFAVGDYTPSAHPHFQTLALQNCE
jgi:hypothetical protein